MAETFHDPDDDPLWKRILFNEFLWAIIVILGVLYFAFIFATDRPPEDEEDQTVEQQED